MKIFIAGVAVLLALPVFAVIAIALGPVLLGILCAVGFGLIVFAIANLLLGLGMLGRSAGKSASRHMHHA